VRERPRQPIEVFELWQIDFKVDIVLQNGTHVYLYTVCDPVGEVCIGAEVFAVQKVRTRTKRVEFRLVRAMLRRCFDQWGALPAAIQTDGESTLVSQVEDPFPSAFALWLAGLGIEHVVTRPGKPTDNAEVERFHRTFNDYAIIGNEKLSVKELQAVLDEAVIDHALELPSRAENCAGRPPGEAHPELFNPPRSYRKEHELAVFDLECVDAFLSNFTWTRKVGKTGQICLGGHHKYYSVGRAYACQSVLVRFDPTDRHFVFYLPASDENEELEEIGRRPARDLEIEDITGLALWPQDMVPQQLSLPLVLCEEVNC
jgi:transposase InsO family protein